MSIGRAGQRGKLSPTLNLEPKKLFESPPGRRRNLSIVFLRGKTGPRAGAGTSFSVLVRARVWEARAEPARSLAN